MTPTQAPARLHHALDLRDALRRHKWYGTGRIPGWLWDNVYALIIRYDVELLNARMEET